MRRGGAYFRSPADHGSACSRSRDVATVGCVAACSYVCTSYGRLLVQPIARRLNVPLDFVRTGHGAARDRPLLSAAIDHEAVTNASDVFCTFYDERLFDAVAAAAADEIEVLGFGPQVQALRLWLRGPERCRGSVKAVLKRVPATPTESVAAWQRSLDGRR